MKKELMRNENTVYYYNEIGTLVYGAPSGISGNLSGISGDLSGIRGDLTYIRGDLSGISGNLDDCDITEEDRKRGVDISELIK